MDNGGFVAAAYVLTALALGGYVLLLVRRARRARARVDALRRISDADLDLDGR